jgi:hypothetical protein
MIPRVIGDRVASLEYSLHEFRVLLHMVPEHEKGGPRLMPCQNIEQRRCEFRVGAIVKRERGDAIGGLNGNDCPNDLPGQASHHSAQRLHSISDQLWRGYLHGRFLCISLTEAV